MTYVNSLKKQRLTLFIILFLMTLRGYLVSDETILLVTKAVVVVLLVILFIYDSIHKDSKSKEKKSRIPAIFKSSYLEAGLFFVLSHFDYLYISIWENGYFWTNIILRFIINLTFSRSLLIVVDKIAGQEFEKDYKEFYKNHKVFFDFWVFLVFGLLLFIRQLFCTVIPYAIDVSQFEVIYRIAVSVMLAMAANALMDIDDKMQFIAEWVIIVFSVVYMCINGNILISSLLILMVAFTNKSPTVILRIFIALGILITFSAFVLSDLHIIPDLTYYNAEVLTDARHSMGIIYATDAGARLTYIVIAYCMIKRNDLRWYNFLEYIPMILVFLLCKNYLLARSNMGWIAVTILLTFLFQIFVGSGLKKVKFLHIIFKALSIICVPFFAIWEYISHYLVVNYEEGMNIPGAAIIGKLFGMRSIYVRLILSKQMLIENFPTLMGNKIRSIGNGGTTVAPEEYKFIDISYMRFTIIHGLIFAVLFILLLTFLMVRVYKTQNYLIIALLALIAVSGFIDHHLEEWHYNIFAVLVFSNIGLWKMDYGVKERKKD